MVNDAQVILGTADEILGNWTRSAYRQQRGVTIDVPDSAAGSMIQVRTNSVYKYGSYDDYKSDRVELFLVDGDGQVIGAGIDAHAGGLETQFEVPEERVRCHGHSATPDTLR